MRPVTVRHLECLPRQPLCAGVCALFALAPSSLLSNVVPVTNCDDSGGGSLRVAVAAAATGDTVDMTNLPLTCSKITLTSGEIVISQPSLILQGPGADKLDIDGNRQYRVIDHQGASLGIYGVSLTNGYVYNPPGLAAGGCIFSSGNIKLKGVVVSGCIAQTYSGEARGGAIDATSLIAYDSTISSSLAACYAGGVARGGGIASETYVGLFSSSVRGNTATCRPGGTAKDGGIYAVGGATIGSSTIADNSSSGDVGGLEILSPTADYVNIADSTISGNSAAGFFGGVASSVHTRVAYSTIAFNYAGIGSPSSGVYQSPGLHVANGPALLELALIANNTYGPTHKENDFSSAGVAPADLSGVFNLIRAATSPVPGFGLISGVCPLLGPLRDNGGPTQTHALLSHSPGIDAGNGGLADYDQRGQPRISGSLMDVGAYEVQQNDIVFNAGFDGCPAL